MTRAATLIVLVLLLLLLCAPSSAATWVSYQGHWIDNTTNSTHTIEMWNATGTTSWITPLGVTTVEYLVVAGGGSGGYNAGGGGGAGGVNTGTLAVSGSQTVIVGAGGVVEASTDGNDGNTSSFGSVSATGGGGGGVGLTGGNRNGRPGGSGGGGGMNVSLATTGGIGNGTEGKNGGTTSVYGGTASYSSAGGGGYSTNGTPGHGGLGRQNPGGNGYNSTITGAVLSVAGGGGGMNATNFDGAPANLWGGGKGGSNGGGAGTAGTPGTGGGGGAGGQGGDATGKAGGSGIVIVRYAKQINASFTALPITGVAPLTVQFTNTSTPLASSWEWNYTALGSSTPITFNTTANPVQSFTGGNYSIKLRAYNAFTSNISTQTTWINASSLVAPVSDFYYSDGVTCVNSLTLFWDLSVNDPTSWYWDFGDNATSTDQNPTHVYTSTGLYTVKLKATNAYGFDWENKTNYVNVTVCPEQELGLQWCGLQTLYFGHQPSPDITGYETLNNYPTGLSETDENITVKNTLGYVQIDTYISPVGAPAVDTLLRGLRRFRTYHYVSGASGTTIINYTFFVRNHHGVETTLYSVETADINDLTVAEQLTSYVAPIDFNLALDDRIGIKMYGKTDHSANIILHFVYEGTTHTSHKESGYFVCPPPATATPTIAEATWAPVMNPSTDVKANYGAMIRQWWWLPVLIAIICLLLRRC